MTEIEALCDICDKYVAVKRISITRGGRFLLDLECDHSSAYAFAARLRHEGD